MRLMLMGEGLGRRRRGREDRVSFDSTIGSGGQGMSSYLSSRS